MDVVTVSMSKKEATEAYKSYLEVVKTRKEGYLEDLKKVYYALKQGKRIIDIFEAFEKTGVNEEGDPKLAISLADKKTVYFWKETGGGGLFCDNDKTYIREGVVDVRLPGETFPNWETEKAESGGRGTKRRIITTNVPIVPAYLLPKGKLNNYYLLWEVEEWKEKVVATKAADPFLLGRINANTFIVFAAWDLTEVEQIVMRGR